MCEYAINCCDRAINVLVVNCIILVANENKKEIKQIMTQFFHVIKWRLVIGCNITINPQHLYMS